MGIGPYTVGFGLWEYPTMGFMNPMMVPFTYREQELELTQWVLVGGISHHVISESHDGTIHFPRMGIGPYTVGFGLWEYPTMGFLNPIMVPFTSREWE